MGACPRRAGLISRIGELRHDTIVIMLEAMAVFSIDAAASARNLLASNVLLETRGRQNDFKVRKYVWFYIRMINYVEIAIWILKQQLYWVIQCLLNVNIGSMHYLVFWNSPFWLT